MFEVENGKRVTVIEIPCSTNKPHVIKEYVTPKGKQIPMFIPIRKSTSINAANKYDLDSMYFERNKRIVVDYGLDIKVMKEVRVGYGGSTIQIPTIVINKGVNVNCINGGYLVVEKENNQVTKKELKGIENANSEFILKIQMS